ncbi:MAG: hypothetical protein JNK05_07065 [Myxococcales bacterium]|nr:hypothetical protein [Myxococcales bacterium]
MDLIDKARLPSFYVGSFGASAFRRGASFGDRQCIALSRDARSLYYATYPRVVELSADDGRVRRSLGNKDAIFDLVAPACDGSIVAFEHEAVRWLDATSGEELCVVPVRAAGQSRIAVSPTEPRRVASGKYYGQWALFIIDGAGEPRVVNAEVPDVARCGSLISLSFSKDGSELFAACRQGVLRYDARTGALKETLFDPRGLEQEFGAARSYLSDFCVLDERAALALVGGTLLVRVDLATNRAIATLLLGSDYYARLSAPSPGGRVTVGTAGKILVVDVRSLAIERAITGAFSIADGADVLVEPRSERAWIVDGRGALHRLALDTGALELAEPCSFPTIVRWRSDDELVVGRWYSPIEFIDLRSDASTFLALGSDEHAIEFSERRGSALVRTDTHEHSWLSLSDRTRTALGNGARSQAIVAGDRLWIADVKRQKLLSGDRSIDLAPCKHIVTIAVSPDETRAFVALKSEALLVDLASDAVLARYKLLGAERAQFVTEDELVIMGSKGTKWIDPATGTVRAHSPKMFGSNAACSRDGQIVAVIGGVSSVAIATRDRPTEVVSFEGAAHPQRAAFNEDATRLAVAGAESVVRVFDVTQALATRDVPKDTKRKRTAK